MLHVNNLRFSYGSREVLRGVSFAAQAGELIFLLGANGAGKTTLFRCILGLNPVTEGEILLQGTALHTLPPKQQAQKIAYIPQNHSNVFDYSVLDMVLMGTSHRLSAFASPGKQEKQLAENALRQVGMEQLAHREYAKLSGGEQQLILIARALAQKANVLLMDEPTASLDYGNQLKVLRKIQDLAAQGYTVVLSSHNPQQALLYASRVVALDGGLVVADGTPEEVLSEALLYRLYGVQTHFTKTPDGVLISPTQGQ